MVVLFTGNDLASFNILGGATWLDIMPRLITIGTLCAIAILSYLEVKGAILVSIAGGSIVYYFLGGFQQMITSSDAFNFVSPSQAFHAFATLSFGKVFTEGLNFDAYLSQPGTSEVSLILVLITTTLAFCLVDMFDTMGTLHGACQGMMVKNPETGEEEIPNMENAMLADAIATTAGSILGTSTVTTFVESASAVAAGARTGLAALVTAGCFLLSLVASPIASMVPSCAYSAALIYVGYLMIRNVVNVDWADETVGVPAFIAFLMMSYFILNFWPAPRRVILMR